MYACFKLSKVTGDSINFGAIQCNFFLPDTIKCEWASSVLSRAAAFQVMSVGCLCAEAHGTASCKKRVTWLIAGLVGQFVEEDQGQI